MIISLLLLALVAAPAPVGKRLPFLEDDYPTALAMAKKSNVPLFVDAWAPWCHTCVFMKEHVFNRPELLAHGQRYVFLAIDTEKEKNAAFLQKFPIDVWPTLLVVDSANQTVALRWLGSANVEQFGRLLDDGEKAVKLAALPAGSAEQKLAQADRLYGEKKLRESAVAFREALAVMNSDHPRRPRTLESLLTVLGEDQANQQCVELTLAQAPPLPRGPSFVNAVYLGLSCLAASSSKEPWRADAGPKLFALGQEALKVEGILADDRSGLYEALVDFLAEKGEKKASVELAKAWLSFLEAEAGKAPSFAARAVFDPHRLNAALASGQPERVVPALLLSEKQLPTDYNPPARLAVAYRELGKLDEALAAAERALKKVYGPRKIRVLETKASILAKKGELAGQKQVLAEAVAYARALPEGQRSLKTIARLEEQAGKLK